MKIGNLSISKIYQGATKIEKIYLGSTVIYEAATPANDTQQVGTDGDIPI